MSESRVIVIGNGVIGLACAHYLRASGWEVAVIDRQPFGAGCSHGNCGLICPSHVLPLAVPGAVSKTLAAMVQKNAPFYIKPRFDPVLWLWLLRFAARCRERPMMEAGRARHALLVSSVELYKELLSTRLTDCECERKGCLYVYESEKELEKFTAVNDLLTRDFGVSARRIGEEELLELEPALKAGAAGAWHYDCDFHLRPDRLMTSWRDDLARGGVEFRDECALDGFVNEGGRARSASTSRGEMEGDVFVVAAGAVTPMLNRHLGCRIPIQPGKGYSITMPRPRLCPRMPIIFQEHKVAVTPMRSGYRLGSTMEFSGYDTSLSRRRLDVLKDGARHYLHDPYCEPVENEWYGWRPMTFNGLPLIDRSPVMENVYVAAGHNMLGLSMAPATGKLVAELVAGGKPHLDPAPYAVSR